MRMAKEAYSHGKRGLFTWQKGPIHMAKEAYLHGKRGLSARQKRPNNLLAHLSSFPARHPRATALFFVTRSIIFVARFLIFATRFLIVMTCFFRARILLRQSVRKHGNHAFFGLEYGPVVWLKRPISVAKEAY